jgi:hypothetical protein
MKYEQTHHVDRIMHAEPLGDVCHTSIDIHEKYKNLEILLRTTYNKHEYDLTRIIFLMNHNPFKLGTDVKICTSGNYQGDILNGCKQKIGGIFALKTDEKPTCQKLYETTYGKRPQ